MTDTVDLCVYQDGLREEWRPFRLTDVERIPWPTVIRPIDATRIVGVDRDGELWRWRDGVMRVNALVDAIVWERG